MSKGRNVVHPVADVPAPLPLEPVASAPAAARRYVRAALITMGCQHLVESAELGVSELVTNACLHARTTVEVALRRSKDRVRIEVTDHSPVLPKRRRVEPLATIGRGLELLEAFGRWGVHPASDAQRKTVWFEPSADTANGRRGRPDAR